MFIGKTIKKTLFKGEILMVNQNFEKFSKIQKEHEPQYVGSNREHKQTVNDPEYNNNEETDKAPGLTGREV